MAFVSGGVNAEALLYASSAALFYAVARAFRRGLSVGRGAAIGAALSVALLSKGTALGFVPALAIALALMIWRAPRPQRRRALRGSVAAVGAGAIPFRAWLALSSTVYHRPGATATAGIGNAPPGAGIRAQIGYIWQLYFPKLPFMNERFHGWLFHDQWFPGFVGRLGYNQYSFPPWFNDLAWWLSIALVVLAGVALFRWRRSVLRRWPETIAYLAMLGAIMAAVGIAVYRLSPPVGPITQSRYLLPLLPLYAGLIALAVRSAGRRFGPALATLVVVAATAHNFAAIMLTLQRYYA
jgi:4-amino-4-deoxy-L-arabinose transferase-like glycosyltransferase